MIAPLPPVTERTNEDLIAGISGATIIISCRAKMFEKMAVDWYDESREELLRRLAAAERGDLTDQERIEKAAELLAPLKFFTIIVDPRRVVAEPEKPSGG